VETNTPPELRIKDFPQLSILCWSLDRDGTIREDYALSIYERNWHLVDPKRLDENEQALIDRLVREYGNGVLHV